MDKIPMCRVCLAKNVQMYLILNKNLRELYKTLTGIQFVTRDRRSILACYFCCTRLKQCYQLQKQCREAEELFAQMMNEDIMLKPLSNPDGLEFYKGFVQTPVVHINISDESQLEYDAIKEELPETLEDIADPLSEENQGCSCLHEEEISAHHPEPYSEDDVPLMEIKIKVEEEPEVSEKNQRDNDLQYDAVAINRRVHTGRTKLEDGITEEENNTELSNTEIDPKAFKMPSESELKIKKPSSKDSDDVNKYRVQSKKGDDLDRFRVQGDKERKKQFYCDTCSCVFSHRRTLITHIRTHTGEKPYKCDNSFNEKGNLNKYITKHTDIRPYKCKICSCSFKQKSRLEIHIRNHNGEKPFKCFICLRSFKQKYHLEQHSYSHTGEKPYKCTICLNSFGQKSGLTMHMRRHTGKNTLQ